MSEHFDSPIDQIKTIEPRERPVRSREHVLCLTILVHPDPGRVGQRAILKETSPATPIPISRLEPVFSREGVPGAAPLATAFISRKPIWCSPGAERALLSCEAGGSELRADGETICAPREFSAEALKIGVVLELQSRVVLLLHRTDPCPPEVPDLGFIGGSDALRKLRSQLVQVAALDTPLLLRGETGVGKELAAQAVHHLGPRKGKPFVEVNLAAVTSSTAASELFGHAQGAFTGATASHPGFFEQADGGTLFLDEVGAGALDLQAMLLRVIETGKTQPVGARTPKRVNVRVIAATDEDLEAAMQSGHFRSPLFHRLSATAIFIPPLRERRQDVAELLFTFLRRELESLGAAHRLAPVEGEGAPWLPPGLVAKLVRFPWPGNVRQLQNLARRVALDFHAEPVIDADAVWRELAESPAPPAAIEPRPIGEPQAGEAAGAAGLPSEDELVAAMQANNFQIGATAAALRISRNTLYALIERSGRLRKAKDIPQDEIQACHQRHGGDLEAMAAELGVSVRALKLRMKDLER